MRIGVGEGAVCDAVAGASLVAPADAAATHDDDVDAEAEAAARECKNETIVAVARVLQVSNDYGMVARLTRDEGEAGLNGVRLKVGRPVQAMLAQAGTTADALGGWRTAAVEAKFGGAHVQVHRDASGEVSLFSRNMKDVTDALLEVVEFAAGVVDDSVILDGEIVAVGDGGELLPL